MLVSTSDKLRKMLAHGSPWLRDRSLSVLAMDEVENEEFLDVVAAAIHFDLVFLKDPMRIKLGFTRAEELIHILGSKFARL